ncbi:MAG TPA: dihydroorotase family protein [Nitrososphaerales archaeon]|nr:dihydroorotase family protein [Nitrososphaerales archaeon]
MASPDLVLEGGRVFLDGVLVEANVAIKDGKILALTRGATGGGRRVDVSGKVVLPGLVDLHSHIRDPGYTYKEDFETGSRAAAAGGVTMFVDMPNVEPPTSSLKTFEEKKAIASRKSLVDFNHFVFPTPSEVQKVAAAGAAGFKIFMVRGAYPHDPRICVEDHGMLYEMFKAVSKTGLPCLVHPSNMSLFEKFYEEHREAAPKEKEYISFGRAYIEELIYGTSVSALVMLAKRSGVRLHLVHTHSTMAIEELRRAKLEGYDITAQVDPKYFITTSEELKRLGPLVLPGGLLGKARVDAIWQAIREGTIDVLATDHAPHTREEVIRTMDKNPWEAPFGCPQLEHYLSVFLNEVSKGSLTLAQLVRASSSTPAKIIGVYPRKGVVQVGSDADLVVVDLKKEKTLTSEKVYSKVGWTPYEGRKVKGVPVMTIRRGEVIMEDGEVTAKKGSGEFVAPLAKKSRHRN